MMKFLLSLLPVLTASVHMPAQEGHRISVQIDGFDRDSLYLGYYLGDKQYLRDTVGAGPDGRFVFSDREKLPGGMYLVVMPPDNNYFQLLVTEGEQQYEVHTDVDDLVGKLRVKGSADNQLFYDYLHFLNEQRPRAEELNKQMQAAEGDEEQKASLQKQLEQINEEVAAYQRKVVQDHPQTLTAAVIRANLSPDMPEFEGTEEEVQTRHWRFMQEHYFDNLDLSDPRLLRTPFLFERMDYYVHKLQVQHPDTIARAIDEALERARPAEETFRFYLVHFLNEAARSNIVGMDAVYVHLVDKYYKTGQAPWTDAETMKKIVENSEALKPLLIGRIAPDITMQKREGGQISLHDVEADYTILYFWKFDCSHCKKSSPLIREFYEKYRDKGVKIFAVCSKFGDDIPKCWEYVDENKLGDWIHVVNPYNSDYMTLYNIKSTPQIYVLDRKKEILTKRIGAEQLEEVMTRIME